MSATSSPSQDEQVTAALAEAGVQVDARSLRLERRDDRLAVRWPGHRMAWFPLNEEGRVSLERERRVLRLLEVHCRFPAPRVLHEGESGWDLRELVPGVADPVALYARVQRDPIFAHALGQALGRMLAEQHTRIPPATLAGWLPHTPNWPRPGDIPHLPRVVDDAKLLARIAAALRRHASMVGDVSEPVLIHGDLGLHNIAVHPDDYNLIGVFDYEGSCFGDRHQDFKYMIFQTPEEPVLDGALSVYEPATATRIDRERVRLLNAVAAIAFLAFRHGHPPEEAWCGRTLAEDLAWTDGALRVVGY